MVKKALIKWTVQVYCTLSKVLPKPEKTFYSIFFYLGNFAAVANHNGMFW